MRDSLILLVEDDDSERRKVVTPHPTNAFTEAGPRSRLAVSLITPMRLMKTQGVSLESETVVLDPALAVPHFKEIRRSSPERE